MVSVLAFGVAAGDFKHIAIDGSFDDWAGISPAFEDLSDTTNSIDYAAVYIANDADYLYLRFTLYAPGDPFTSRENIFIDADNDVASGFPVGGIGSEMLIQSGVGYEERAGMFNDGFNFGGLDWAAAPFPYSSDRPDLARSTVVDMDVVTIPRGADSGTRVKVSGQGPGGGDLVVVVRLRPHAVFTRRGANLERELPITLKEALLGGEVPVTTLKGRVLLKIPPGTQNGRIFRLKGQGMPHLRGDGMGDMLVKVRVLLPTALDPQVEQAARTFLDLADQPDTR